MPSKLPRVRMVAVAGLAALSFGGIAAAAGLAPVAAERATQAAASTAGGQAAFAHGEAASLVHAPDAAAAANSSASRLSDQAAGPDASGAARHGLCQAWLAGQGDDHGRRADAPAFQALAAAAGGADQVAAYCEADAASSATDGQRPAALPAAGGRRPRPPPPDRPPAPATATAMADRRRPPDPLRRDHSAIESHPSW